MKVLLINPPLTMHPLDTNPPSKSVLLGLGYIAAVIQNMRHTVNILDCFTTSAEKYTITIEGKKFIRQGLRDCDICDEIDYYEPDIVGISAMFTPYAWDAHNIARLAKLCNRSVLVIMGGSHATTFPEKVKQDKNVDIVAVGDGEGIMSDLLQNKINSIGIIEDRIQHLDIIPFPAYGLMSHDFKEIARERRDNKFLMRKPIANILTSRGCPNNCYFCSVKLSSTQVWRARSAENVVDEIEMLHDKGYKEFHFVDDNSSVSKPRMIKICDEILRHGLNIKLACPTGIAINTLDYEVLKKMKQAGFYRLCFGIETGNQEHQRTIGKNIDLKKAKKTIATANKLGFWTAATFIFGFPHDTEATLQDTIDFAKQSNLDFALFYLLNPQPKTKVYEIMKEQKLINLDECLEYDCPEWYKIALSYGNGIATKNLTIEQLHNAVGRANREFLKHKIFSPMSYINLLRKIRSIEDFSYIVGLSSYPLSMVRSLIRGGKNALACCNNQATKLRGENAETKNL